MKPVMQTKFVTRDADGNKLTRGNCMAAALASILEKDIEEMPAMRPEDGNQREEMLEYLDSLGIDIHEILYSSESRSYHFVGPCNNAYYIACGVSPRNKDTSHAVIYKSGKLVHDPHPDGTGIRGITGMIFLCARLGE